jgi:hypothetical protein
MGFYSCDSTSAATFDVFETTYDGEVDAQTWLALREADLSSLLSTSTPDTSTTERSGAATIGVSAAATGSSNTAASTTSAPTQVIQKENKKSTPIAAIVGGAVGGIAVIGAIVGVILFFLLKKKKSTPSAAAAGHDPHMSHYAAPNAPPAGPTYPQTHQQPHEAGNTASGYFAPAPMKSDAKYEYNGAMISESQVPAMTPVSPAPAYSAPVAGPPPPHMMPSPATSSHPSMDNRFSAAPPPAGWVPQPQSGYPPPQQPAYSPAQQPAAPVELGNTYALPSQYHGRPVYEAA